MDTTIDDLIPGQTIVWGDIDSRNTHPYLFNGLVTRRIFGWPISRYYEFIPINSSSVVYNEVYHEDDNYEDHRGRLHRYRDGRIRNTYLPINTTLRYLDDGTLYRIRNDNTMYTRTIDGNTQRLRNPNYTPPIINAYTTRGTRLVRVTRRSVHDVLNMIPSSPPLPNIRVQDDDIYFISLEPIQRGDKLYKMNFSLGGTLFFKWSQNENENELFQYIHMPDRFREVNNKIFIKNPITRAFDVDITTIVLGIADIAEESSSGGGTRSRRSRGGRKGRTKKKTLY